MHSQWDSITACSREFVVVGVWVGGCSFVFSKDRGCQYSRMGRRPDASGCWERQRWEAEGGKSRGWGSRKRKLFLVLQGGIGTIVIKASF